eukprot:61542-Pleurochrysis_carterae.AAC.2
MLGALSLQLTEAIALVEIQRSTLSELILRLASDAQQLNGVAAALAEAATAQAEVLSALQRGDGTAEQNGHAARSSNLDDSSGCERNCAMSSPVAHARTRAHTQRAYVRTRAYMCTRKHVHSHAREQLHTPARVHARTHVHMHARTHA